MVDIDKFSSVEELYNRVLPALKVRVSELRKEKIYINTYDIWNYCIEHLWKNKNDLRIHELVDDILKIDGLKISIYVNRNSSKNDGIDKNER